MMNAMEHPSLRVPLENAPANRRLALIIEDEPQFSNLLAYQLLQVGYRPLQRFHGREAIEACVLRPDLITLDILLPDLDGWSVLKEIRSAPFMQRVPVLVISVLSQAELGPDCGPTAFVHKPIPRAELVDAIERLAPDTGAPRRVLHVDDDPMITDMVGAMLPAAQFEVHSVTSARQAAESILTELPDLILLDLVMPHVSGFEILQTLRADPRTRHLPVLVLTAKYLTPQEQLELSQAAQVVLTKADFTTRQLLKKLRYLERANLLFHSADDAGDRDQLQSTEVGLDMTQFRDDFIAEARACLETLQACTRADGEAATAALVDEAGRAAHTLKGASGMMGYTALGELAARAETLLRSIASGAVDFDEAKREQLSEWTRSMAQRVDAL